MKIKWNKLAVKQLLDIVLYLEDNDLMEYAERIEYQMLSKIKSLPNNLDTFQADRLKKNMTELSMLLKLIVTEFHLEKSIAK